MIRNGRHQLVEDFFDRKDFFFANAQQTVVKGCSGNNRLGRIVDVSCRIDHNRWISRSSHDGAFRALQSCACHRWSAGHDQKFDATMIKHGLSRLNRGRSNNCDQVFEPGRGKNSFIKTSHTFAGDLGSTRMGVADDCVSRSHHVDKIAGQCWQRMRHGSDCPNHPKRSIFGDHQPL